jgi:Ser/Thr protein kinase RdoA (MazF antagonist)
MSIELEAPSPFGSFELALVLSHYDLAPIVRITSFTRGSRKAPKVIIRTRDGDYLLKRRAPERNDPYRVAFAHELMLRLTSLEYPVPRLVGTRGENNSLLQLLGHTYELFEYVTGERFDGSAEQTREAGAALAQLHRALRDHKPAHPGPAGSFHNAPGVPKKLRRIPRAIHTVDPGVEEQAIMDVCEYLYRAYREASQRASEMGFDDAPAGIIHGDWHPGNLIFRDGGVAAVLDFDSSRFEPIAADAANAALQFSLAGSPSADPSTWPDELDPQRLERLFEGYHSASTDAEFAQARAALPWLMIEALIVESVVTIAATGSFSHVPGWTFLQMVQRKVRWMRRHAKGIIKLAGG